MAEPSSQPKTCDYPDCDAPVHCKDLCQGHYKQHRRGEDLRPLRPTISSDLGGKLITEIRDAGHEIVKQLIELRADIAVVTRVIQEADGHRMREHGERQIERAKHGTS